MNDARKTSDTALEDIVYITVDDQVIGDVLASAILTDSYPPTIYDALRACGVGIDGSGYYLSVNITYVSYPKDEWQAVIACRSPIILVPQ